MKTELETGDVVYLNSGSPALTVAFIFQPDPQRSVKYAEVYWIDGGKSCRESFPVPCLKLKP